MTATLALLLFKLDLLRLGIALAVVERVEHACEVTPLPGAPAAVLGVINLQGRVATVIDLRRRLGLPLRPLRPADAFVILRLPQHTFAITVDDVEGVAEVPHENLVPGETLVDGLATVQGLVKTPEGLLLIDDPHRFLDIDDMRALAEALDARAAES